MPSGYASREDPGQMKKNKQSMADLKLRRLTELNTRLREDLERERIPVSQAAKRYLTCSLCPQIYTCWFLICTCFHLWLFLALPLFIIVLRRSSGEFRANIRNSIINYTNSTKDFMVPSIWGGIPKGEDPYVVQTSNGEFNQLDSVCESQHTNSVLKL